MTDKRYGHRTVEQRRALQLAQLRRLGKEETQSADMLDLFLLGESAADIAKAYKVTLNNVYATISNEALYRLMEQRAVERLEEITEMQKK